MCMTPAHLSIRNVLDLDDVSSLWPLLALLNAELNAVALIEVAEAFTLNSAVMYKDIPAAIVRRRKSEAFGAIEPLYCTDDTI